MFNSTPSLVTSTARTGHFMEESRYVSALLAPTSMTIMHHALQDTATAASAFKMLHNQIEAWALEKKWELTGPFAHSSYCAGVAKRVLHDITFGTSEDSSQPRESFKIPHGPSGNLKDSSYHFRHVIVIKLKNVLTRSRSCCC